MSIKIKTFHRWPGFETQGNVFLSASFLSERLSIKLSLIFELPANKKHLAKIETVEVLFTYISGLGEKIDACINLLNQNSPNHFSKTTYSNKVERVALILVTKNFTKEAVEQYKTKFVGRNTSIIGICIYLDFKQFLKNGLAENIEYIQKVTINTLRKNVRLKKLLVGYMDFVTDLDEYFAKIRKIA